MAQEDIVFVGNKPVMNYVLAVVTQFNSGAEDVRIMARGRAISRAVDVAEVSRSRFLPNVTVKGISISLPMTALNWFLYVKPNLPGSRQRGLF